MAATQSVKLATMNRRIVSTLTSALLTWLNRRPRDVVLRRLEALLARQNCRRPAVRAQDVVGRQRAVPIADPILIIGFDIRGRDVPRRHQPDRIVHRRLHDDAIGLAVPALDALPDLDALELRAVVGIAA